MLQYERNNFDPRPGNFRVRVEALGGYLTGDYGQVVPVELKAIIDYDGKTETIISSQTFTFNPLVVNNFYWVMAYPVKVEIKKRILKKIYSAMFFWKLRKKPKKNLAKIVL